jgi:type IV conjugative transfer system coupling protein TraD
MPTMAEDLRFSKKAATLTHDSARGKVVRNADSFTRGSQLFSHQVLMTWAGLKMPLQMWLFTTLALGAVLGLYYLSTNQMHMVTMLGLSSIWNWVGLDPMKTANLTLANGQIDAISMHALPYHPAVVDAWATTKKVTLASTLAGFFVCFPLTIWYVEFSRKRGSEILKERHERGAILVSRDELAQSTAQFNAEKHAEECLHRKPPTKPDLVRKEPIRQRVRKDYHVPYRMATVPVPWRLEQSHAMLIGTTGSGKTTELKKIVRQARTRGHRAVIFDLTGTFVESFYDKDRDVILNPMDQRCEAWSIFNDCDTYADFMSAANALIPTGHNAEDDFWQKAARMLFVEMCMKMLTLGVRTNGGLAHFLMQADLKALARQLEGTAAGPLVSPQAAKMAESIRATFTANANVMRFLPEPAMDEDGFSINRWMTQDVQEGSILFITSTHTDLVLNRPLLTLWMDLAVNALFRMGQTRNLRTWFLLDEVHALHRLPAIEHGLQTARAVGGAFVLGMHSFDKLAETYGENGAVNLASLARTKLVLATADIETAKRCADYIGNREVRQVDEAYSYGYNNSRDASTLTPRKQIENLVMPDDITNLPSLHGFIKFPDGFPAAPIKLTWEDHPVVAEGFKRVTAMRAAEYVPPAGQNADNGDGGREGDAPDNTPIPPAEMAAEGARSEAMLAAERMHDEVEEKGQATVDRLTGEILQTGSREGVSSQGENAGSPAQKVEQFESPLDQVRRTPAAKDPGFDKGRSADAQAGKSGARSAGSAQLDQNNREDRQESQTAREERLGFGAEERGHKHHHHYAKPDISDDMDMER